MLALETMAEEEITGSTKSQARQTQDDGSSEADLRPTQNDGLGRDSRGKAEINNAVGSSPHLSDSKVSVFAVRFSSMFEADLSDTRNNSRHQHRYEHMISIW